MRALPRPTSKAALVFASRLLLALSLASTLLTARARADAKAAPKAEATTAAPTDAARERARTAYREGQKQFGAGHFDDAAAAFEDAFAAVPNPVVLLSLAESYSKGGKFPEALAALEKYLVLRPDAPDRTAIEGRIKGLQSKPAMLSVTSVPEDADVEVDGSPMFRTPVQLQLTPASHEIRCTRPGYRPQVETVVLAAGTRQTLQCHLDVLPPQPKVAPLALEPVEQPSGRPMTAIWIAGGVGAAGLVTAGVFSFLALEARHDFDEHPTAATADKGERFGIIADIGFGVGVLGVGTAAVLYLVNDDASSCVSAAANGVTVKF